MDLEIRLLRTFRAVAQLRSFTGAARNLKLSQSGISQQIGMLERELGTQLLVRSNKFVRLTPAGEILLQCATYRMVFRLRLDRCDRRDRQLHHY